MVYMKIKKLDVYHPIKLDRIYYFILVVGQINVRHLSRCQKSLSTCTYNFPISFI